MKKPLLGVVAVILLASIYYFTTGSEQLTNEMKARVNTELTTLKERGFAIEDREVKPKEEYFVLNFDDPKKMMAFFNAQGSKVSIDDMQALKGLKIGVDLKYLNDSYSALSADMYPLNLPTSLKDAEGLTQTDKDLMKQVDIMLGKKDLLIHVDFNKLLSSFKGYVKDIDETFKLENETAVALKGMTFEGTLKDDNIHTLSQKIKTINIKTDDNVKISLEDMSSEYAVTGETKYDSTYKYAVKKLLVSGKEKSDTYSMLLSGINASNLTEVKSDLASNKMKLTLDNVEFANNDQKIKLTDNTFTFDIAGLDMSALKSLEKIDVENEAEVNKLVQTLISKGITMEIPTFEVKKIEYLGEKMDGFLITSAFEVIKTANIKAIQANPFTALKAINTKTKIVLSPALYSLIAAQPQAMMLVMIVQPKDVDGKKVYELELKDGKFLVNGKTIM
jgi:hypothetical protein